MRVRVGRDSLRIFCFLDRERLVILINGFQKKTQKTPRREIQKAGTTKSYISKIENNVKEVRLSTLQKIVHPGLGGDLDMTIRL